MWDPPKNEDDTPWSDRLDADPASATPESPTAPAAAAIDNNPIPTPGTPSSSQTRPTMPQAEVDADTTLSLIHI